MATYYSQGDGAWSTLTNWDTNAGGGGTDPASVADMDDDTFIIQAGHDIEFDVDMSGFANGIAGLTINGHATTDPGMLYCKYSADGTYHLKLKTGTNIAGSNVTPTTGGFGRILANSDGVWANSTALPFGRKFIIEFAGTSAGNITGRYLDVRLYCTEPTNKFVHVYGTKYDFDAATEVNISTGVLTLNTTAPADGTNVCLVPAAGATMPTGLYADRPYYVRSSSGSTCKLAYENSDATIEIPSAVGSGTIYLLTAQAASTATLNVLEDVTADTPWTATSGHDKVVLVDVFDTGSTQDVQRTAISAIDDADTITLEEAVDSTLQAGARLYLSSRNISIRTNTTNSTAGIVGFASKNSYATFSFIRCEINSLAAGNTGSTSYGYGLSWLYGNDVFEGVINGANYGIASTYGITLDGIILTGTYSIRDCFYCTVNSKLIGATAGMYLCQDIALDGEILGCGSGFSSSRNIEINGSIVGGAATGSTSADIRYNNTSQVWQPYACRTPCHIVVKAGALIKSSAPFYQRNSLGNPGRASFEAYGNVNGASQVHDALGDIIRTACNGAVAGYPDQDPDGGSGYCIEASNLQSNISSLAPLYLIHPRTPHRIWLAAGTYTITYKVYTTFSTGGGIADNGLVIAATYISDDSPFTVTRSTDSQAINTKTSDTDWTQTLAITITTALAGWAEIEIYLTEYEANNEVFVWPVPAIT